MKRYKIIITVTESGSDDLGACYMTPWADPCALPVHARALLDSALRMVHQHEFPPLQPEEKRK